MDVGVYGREDPEMGTIPISAGKAIRITACPELCFGFQEIYSTVLKPQMSWCCLLQQLLNVTLILTLIHLCPVEVAEGVSDDQGIYLESGKGSCSMMLVAGGGERAELRVGYGFPISYTSHISLCLEEVNKIMLRSK